MPCDELRDDDIEAYLAGKLADAEMTRVETHVFDCSRCVDTLETLQAARVVLKEPARRAVWWQTQTFAIAASLVAVVGIAGVVRLVQRPGAVPVQTQMATAEAPAPATSPVAPETLPTPPLATPSAPAAARVPPAAPPAVTAPRRNAAVEALRALVRFDAPPVLALTVRSGEQQNANLSPGLSAALRAYVQRDYKRAFTQFAALDPAERDLAAVQFFGGVSALKVGRLGDARRWLGIAAKGDQATSAVEAWLYLGYAHLASGDARAAVGALDRYIALEGDQVVAARQLRSDVLAIEPAR